LGLDAAVAAADGEALAVLPAVAVDAVLGAVVAGLFALEEVAVAADVPLTGEGASAGVAVGLALVAQLARVDLAVAAGVGDRVAAVAVRVEGAGQDLGEGAPPVGGGPRGGGDLRLARAAVGV